MTIEVKEETNGSFTISWDEKDPVESMMNTWTESDFLDTISSYLNHLKDNPIQLKKDIVEILLSKVLEEPTEENKENYLNKLNELEYALIEESAKYPDKSQENLDLRKESFSTRATYAKKMLSLWVNKYQTTEGCPHSYQDTLNIPFQQIKKPK
jgi:hypothetical protein